LSIDAPQQTPASLAPPPFGIGAAVAILLATYP
jgi:hypothetical protein